VPIEVTEVKTKSGHPVLRTNFVSEVTLGDVDKYHQRTPPGQYDDWGHLVVGNVTGVSNEVKKKLSSRKRTIDTQPPVAIVLSSALMRMAASLTMRVMGNDNSESFKSEEDGLAWLEERLNEKKMPPSPRGARGGEG
jgi:hypothetical protein